MTAPSTATEARLTRWTTALTVRATRAGWRRGATTVMAAARVPRLSAASSAASDRPARPALVSAPCGVKAASTPALNVSPAPTVSATVTLVAATKRSCVAVTARAPFAPSVMKTTFGPCARRPRASVVRSPVAFQPVQIFVRQLHDVGPCHHPLDPRAVGRLVGDEAGADVGVDHRDAARRLARGLQRLVAAMRQGRSPG